MTCNKVSTKDKELFFVFNFIDELCYIRYNEEVFSTFEKKPYSRINAEYDMKDYFFIPIENLITIKVY